MPTQTLPVFNEGRPLRVVKMSDGRFGVLDDSLRRVWIEFDMESSLVRDVSYQYFVSLRSLPSQYGTWNVKSIGGVSKTVRRVGVLRASAKCEDPLVLFAVHAPGENVVQEALSDMKDVSVGATQKDDEHGWVSEIIVVNPEDAECVSARIANVGATPLFEDSEKNSQRSLAVERLDRIGAAVVTDDRMVDVKEGLHGLRRGCDNWVFSWVPPGWEPPITWDHMVRNVKHLELRSLPQPLRQHVAQERLDSGDHDAIGSYWMRTAPPIPSEEAWSESHPDECPPFPLRRVLAVDEDTRSDITNGFESSVRVGAHEAHHVDGIPRVIVLGDDNEAYAPVDTRAALRRYIPRGGRYVSPALSLAQSKQLIECFYFFCVSRDGSEDERHAMRLIMFQYMKERGYAARWLGKYEQDAHHIGNGDTFRRFSSKLSQYDTHKLPADVLNRLCNMDGTLKNRGSKGSRSKYVHPTRERYAPKRRMMRSRESEVRMLHRE